MEATACKQNSRKKWLKNGDRNSKYFHMLANHRRRINYIEEIIDGKLTKGNEELREGERMHFQKLYTELTTCWPRLDDLTFNSLDERESNQLEMNFIENELLDCLWECDGDKAPGPDGFNIKFIQSFWEIVKGDIIDFLKDFHEHETFVRSLNSAFLVMICKKTCPECIDDYQPISLIGCIYELLYKVLAKRLSKVLNQLIGNYQNAFVFGR